MGKKSSRQSYNSRETIQVGIIVQENRWTRIRERTATETVIMSKTSQPKKTVVVEVISMQGFVSSKHIREAAIKALRI